MHFHCKVHFRQNASENSVGIYFVITNMPKTTLYIRVNMFRLDQDRAV